VTPKFTLGFDAKTYEYGSNTNANAKSTTGVSGKSYTISYTKQGTATTLTGNYTTSVSDSNITVVEGDNVSNVKLSVSYDAAADGTYIPKTNLGNAYPASRVTAGTATNTTTNKITGYYAYFMGYKAEGATLADPTAITSDQVRAFGVKSAFETSLACNKMQQMFFACYKGYKTKITVENATNGAP